MARVTTTREEVERTLQMAEYQWERLPEVEDTIDNWDQLDQILFIEEWPLEEQRLKRLREFADKGALDKEQQARYEQLECTIARNRPIIQRLQNS